MGGVQHRSAERAAEDERIRRRLEVERVIREPRPARPPGLRRLVGRLIARLTGR